MKGRRSAGRFISLAGALILLVGGSSVVAGGLPAAQACAIDGIPSLSANGQLALRNVVAPTAKTFLTWSPFVFQQPLVRNQVLHLSEDTAKVAKVLTSAELHGRWRWAFGDGQTGTGHAIITHRYVRAGHYCITVSMYDPLYKGWHTFDSVTLTIIS